MNIRSSKYWLNLASSTIGDLWLEEPYNCSAHVIPSRLQMSLDHAPLFLNNSMDNLILEYNVLTSVYRVATIVFAY